MILYHGSNVVVKKPIIITSLKGRDFGNAFYLTPIKEQAERMAIRKVKLFNGKPIVSVFEYNENVNDIKYKKFHEANMEWLDTIISCRCNPNFKHGFDIIESNIADDSVGETINFVMAGVMRKEDAISKLKFQKINYQYAFCTNLSLTLLKFKNSYEVKQ